MSGGSLDYFYSSLEDHVGDFEDKELDDLVKDLAHLFYEKEWYLSGDTNIGRWNEARDEFKQKWFTQFGRQERIDEYLKQIKDELYRSFGLTDEYCRNCAHWTENFDSYGDCDNKDYLTHRSESCDKFERRSTGMEGKEKNERQSSNQT